MQFCLSLSEALRQYTIAPASTGGAGVLAVPSLFSFLRTHLKSVIPYRTSQNAHEINVLGQYGCRPKAYRRYALPPLILARSSKFDVLRTTRP